MRIITRDLLLVSALALLGTLSLAGCAAAPSPKPSASTATDAPVFASDADALAAATEAYAAYLLVIDAMLSNGGGDTSGLAGVATEDAFAAEIKTARLYSERNYRSVGSSSFDSVQLQTVEDDGHGIAIVSTYLCSDVMSVDVVDSAGSSVVPEERVDRFPLQVTFQNANANSARLLISSSETWSGKNFC
jgi:hypothetical protein